MIRAWKIEWKQWKFSTFFHVIRNQVGMHFVVGVFTWLQIHVTCNLFVGKSKKWILFNKRIKSWLMHWKIVVKDKSVCFFHWAKHKVYLLSALVKMLLNIYTEVLWSSHCNVAFSAVHFIIQYVLLLVQLQIFHYNIFPLHISTNYSLFPVFAPDFLIFLCINWAPKLIKLARTKEPPAT